MSRSLVKHYNMYILQRRTGLVIKLQRDFIYYVKDVSRYKDIKDNSYFNYRCFWIFINFLIFKCNYITTKCCITSQVKIFD
jgi:hypothetical protein